MMVMVRQEGIEHAKFRALAQLIIDQEKGIEAFEEYMKTAFPYIEGMQRRDKDHYIKILKEEVSKGPLAVKAQAEPKIKKPVAKTQETSQPKREALYGKLQRLF